MMDKEVCVSELGRSRARRPSGNSDIVIVDLVQGQEPGESASSVVAAVAEELSPARTLYRGYKQNTREAEEASLNYLTSIHHPVISCFREITRTDILHLFSTHKIQKCYTNLELSIFCLGMLDYVAVCVDNPLYNENGKLSDKTVPKIITKILDEFKGILHKWGLNSNHGPIKKCLDIVFSFLRRLIPCFTAIKYDIRYSQLIDLLEQETRGKKLHKSPSDKTGDVSNIIDVQDVLLELQLSNILNDTDTGREASPSKNNKQKLTKTRPKFPNSSVRSIPTTSNQSANGKSDEHALSVPDPLPQHQPGRTFGIKRPSPVVSVTCKSEPSAKVQKLTESQVAPSTKQTPKNAFEILMNRSRQLAQQRKVGSSAGK